MGNGYGSFVYILSEPTGIETLTFEHNVLSGAPNGAIYKIELYGDVLEGNSSCQGQDTDNDGIPDHLDIDSDNDGIADIVESGGTDTNGDGLVDNFTDTDNDGLHDPYDADNGGTTVVPTDTDTDGVADYLDLDADNDGIYDVVEGGDGASDTNNDGVVDSNDTGFADANSNGMADNTESTTAPDSDTDGIADYLELDSDGDGCNDVAEAGYTDANGDGILGAASPTINTNGTVDTTGTSSGGYNTPADIDGNTVADYTEVGPNNASAETLTACDSLVWNGTTYTTSGTYTYTTTNMSGCDSIVTLNLTITPTEDATFAYGASSYCASATDPTPTVSGVSGGVFSSTTGLVINSSTGAIDLDSSTAGTYTVTYSTSSTEQTISTSNLFTTGPNATWTHVYASTVLSDGAASQNTQTLEINITSLPPGGANLRVVKSTANGNGFNGPSQALQLGTNTFTVGSVNFDRYVKFQFSSGAINFNNLVVNGSQIDLTSGGSCPGTSTQSVTITPDEDATFAYGSSNYCSSATDPTPTVSGVSGGVFSSTTGLTINASTGVIDLDASTAGTYVVTYSTASTEQTISTSNLFTTGPNATWTHVYASTVLSDGAASQNTQTLEINITSLPPGGANLRVVKSTANGNGFNGPSQALQLGTNTFTVGSVNFDRYVKFQFSSGAINFDNLVVNGNTIDLNPGTCPGTATDTITITPSEDATFSYDTTNYCSVSTDPTPTINGTTGGVFSATPTGLTISASTGAIDLDASTAGTYTVQYITSTSTCADTATTSITVETCTDTDGDGIPDITDLDDDNDGILDSEEGCSGNSITNVTNITLEGPAANQTGTNGADANKWGWISLDEQLKAGQRLIMDRDFFEDLYSEIPHPYGNIVIGLKSSTWTNNMSIYQYDAFAADFYLIIQRYQNGNIIARFYSGVSNPSSGNSTLTQVVTSSSNLSSTSYEAFFELTDDGNNIRFGQRRAVFGGNSSDDVNTTSYEVWNSSERAETGDQGYGYTTVDVIFRIFANGGNSSAPAFDTGDVDWTKD